ncbi:MAG: peptidyl-prolyl cis-trans isomerase [bacterium]
MLLRINVAGVARVTLLTAAIYPVMAPPGPACADGDVLATVDGEPAVTFEDVSYYLGKVRPAAEARVTVAEVAALVEILVDADVMLREAEARGYADEQEFKNEVDGHRHARLRERMREVLVEKNAVTENDLRTYFAKDSKWRKYALIEAKTRAEAEAAHGELREGKPWPDVVRAYSLREETWEEAGVSLVPLVYDGMPASKAVFATPVGEYTAPVPANDGVRWHIYRVDKVVHGRTDSFEEARPQLRNTVEPLRGYLMAADLASELRGSVPIQRNGEMWNALEAEPFTEFHARWATAEVTASDVGGVAVTGEELFNLISNYFFAPDEGVEARREKDPDDFAYVTDLLLRKLEDEALLEYEALRRGLDRDADMRREFADYRAELLTDRFITREFVAKLPPVTAEDCAAYYEAHKEEFVVPEKVEVYMVALPDREKLRASYAEVEAGGNIVDINEAYNRALGTRLMDMYEPPPVLPPGQQEWRGVVTVTKEPGAEGPDGPLAEELRPRLFPFDPEGLRKLGDVFQLRDGREAFYEPLYYQPFAQKKLDNDGTIRKCQKKAWAAYYAGEGVRAQSLAWLASLRGRHDVERAVEFYEAAAARLNAED